MCGIYGFSVKEFPATNEGWSQMRTVLNLLAEKSAARGRQSFGWVGRMPYSSGVIYARGIGNAEKIYDGVLPVTLRIGLGHTRYATTGATSIDNCHPFRFGDAFYCHNGTITNHEKYGKYEVDSQALLDRISQRRDSELRDMEGYGAVAWLSVDKDEAHVCKLNRGSLAGARVMLHGGGRMFIWCSVLPWSDWQLKKENWKKGYSVTPYEFKEGLVYRIAGDRHIATKRRLKLKDTFGRNACDYTGNIVTSGKRTKDYRRPSAKSLKATLDLKGKDKTTYEQLSKYFGPYSEKDAQDFSEFIVAGNLVSWEQEVHGFVKRVPGGWEPITMDTYEAMCEADDYWAATHKERT